jgi:hypothetical protein
MESAPTIRRCGTGGRAPNRFVGQRSNLAITSAYLLEMEEYRMYARKFISSLELEEYQNSKDVENSF